MTHKLLLGLLIGCILISCINDRDFQIKGVQANPTLVVPFATGDISIADLLSDKDSARIIVTSDGLMLLDYDTLLFQFNDIRKLVDIPNISSLAPIPLSVPAKSYPAHQDDITSSSSSTPVDMGISPEKLTEIGFKKGTLTYSMSLSPSNSKFLDAVLVSIPEFTDSEGQAFSQEVSGSGSLSLAGYTFKSANANKFTLKLTLIIKKNNQAVTITAGTNLNVSISFTNMDFTYIKGFLGDQIANPPTQSVYMPPFSTNLQNGATVSFAKPTMDLDVISDYGVPLNVTFGFINATKNASTVAIQTNPASTSQIPINAPSTLGTSEKTSVPVTNVKQLIDFHPTGFTCKVSGHINAGLTSGNDFLADTSEVRVRIHTKIPLFGQASNIILRDTIDVGLNDIDQLKIDSASLKVNITNQLPLDAKIQLVMLDEKNNFLDSLLTASQSAFVKGSTVDSNGDLLASGVVDEFIQLQKDKTAKLLKTKKIILLARMNTIKNESGVAIDVKFRSQYKINIKLGLRTIVSFKNNS